MSKLTLEQVKYNLGRVPGWRLDAGQLSLSRTVTCQDLLSAVHLAGLAAERVGQDSDHLEMRLTGHEVTFILTSKSAKGLTGTDFALAQMINKLL